MQKLTIIALILFMAGCATNNPQTTKDYENNKAYCSAQTGAAALGVASMLAGGGNVNFDTRCLNRKFTDPKAKK